MKMFVFFVDESSQVFLWFDSSVGRTDSLKRRKQDTVLVRVDYDRTRTSRSTVSCFRSCTHSMQSIADRLRQTVDLVRVYGA